MLSDNWKLYIYRNNFDLLNKVDFDSKYSVGMYFDDENDTFLLLAVDSKNIQII